jgi:hypothetical protein
MTYFLIHAGKLSCRKSNSYSHQYQIESIILPAPLPTRFIVSLLEDLTFFIFP